MVAPTGLISADSPKECFRDTIKIKVDVVYPVPVTPAVFPTSTVVMRLAEHEEVIQGNGYDKKETKSKQNRTKPSTKQKAWKNNSQKSTKSQTQQNQSQGNQKVKGKES
nr:hypothetical protein [Tanacetum cinerariifolium]